jgi:PST family polysaccharide transporter
VAWLVGERIARGAVTVVALAAVARHLTPSGFGMLNFALAIVALMTPLAQMGLDAVLVRDLVRNPARTGALLGTSFVIRLVAGIAVAAGVVASSRGSDLIRNNMLALAPMSLILVSQAGEVADCWFRSRVQSKAVVVIRGSVIVAGALAKLALVAANAGIAAFAWVYTIEAAAFAFGLAAFSFSGRDRAPRWTFELKMASALLKEGWGFALAGLLGALAVRLDQVAVAGVLGDAPAGLYFGALRLMEFPILVATATATSLFPSLAIEGNEPAMHVQLEKVFFIVALVSWVTAIGATVAGPWLTPLILGRAYAQAWPVLAIHGWAALFYFSGFVRANYLALRSASGTQASAAASSLAVQVVFNILLVPRIGICGAALAFLVTQAFNAWVLPCVLAPLRPCLAIQARALIAPWQPGRWREFLLPIHG